MKSIELEAVEYYDTLEGFLPFYLGAEKKVKYSMNFNTGELILEGNNVDCIIDDSLHLGDYYKYGSSSFYAPPWKKHIRTITFEGENFSCAYEEYLPNLETVNINTINGNIKLLHSNFESLYVNSNSTIKYYNPNERNNNYKFKVNNLYFGDITNKEKVLENIQNTTTGKISLTDDCEDFIIENDTIYSADKSCIVYAFSDNKTYEIADSVDTILSNQYGTALDGLTNVEEFKVAKGNLSFKTSDGVLFDRYMHELIKYPKCSQEVHYNIPETVKLLDDFAFADTKCLEELYLPSSVNREFVRSIKNDTKVKLFVNVGSYAHNYVTKNHYYYINVNYDNVKPLNKNEELIKKSEIGDKKYIVRSFTPDKTDEYILKIKNSDSDILTVSYYKNDVFVYDNQNFIGAYNYTLTGKSKSVTVHLKAGKTYYFSIKTENNCDSIISIERANEQKEVYSKGLYYSLDYETKTASVIGPASDHCVYDILPKIKGCTVTSIEDYAFKSCSNMVNEINIPETVRNIGNSAFADCEGLKNVNVDENNSYLKYVDGVLFNNDMTELVWYPNYLNSKDYTIPSSVKVINGGAFYKNSYLKSVLFSNSVESIEEEAFFETKLKRVEIPSSVKNVGKQAFANSSIRELVLNKGLQLIDEGAFENNLFKVVGLPSTVSEIKEKAFIKCNNLQDVFVKNSEVVFDDDIFNTSVTLFGTVGSTAEIYANDNCLDFVDINNINDVDTACSHSAVVNDKAVSATFTKTGKTAGKHCKICGAVIVAQKTVAKLGSPLINKVKSGSKQFTAYWESVDKIDGYQIQYSTYKDFSKGKKLVTISGYKSTSKTVKKLKGKKKYYVRIRAYKTINGVRNYSPWSKYKAVTTKK